MGYTKEQIIQFTINILSGLQIPVMEAENIGVPVRNAVKNLMVLQGMMEAENQENNKSAEGNDDGNADAE